MSIHMSVSQLFDCAVTAENIAHEFYLGLSQKFASRPAISAFWKQMAEDEKEHARMLTQSQDYVPPEKLGVAVDVIMAGKAEKLDVMCRVSVPQMLDEIRTLEDAYQAAHELEDSDINTLFMFLKLKVSGGNEKEGPLSSLIQRHLYRLVEFEESFGNAEARRRIQIDA